MSQPGPTEGPTTPAGAHRRTFNDEFQGQAIEIGERLLALVPELEGIAIIPSWTVTQDRLPIGIVMGRQGALKTPVENMHMATQLHAALRQQLDNIVRIMSAINSEAGRLRGELTDLNTQILQRKHELLLNAPAAPRGEPGQRS